MTGKDSVMEEASIAEPNDVHESITSKDTTESANSSSSSSVLKKRPPQYRFMSSVKEDHSKSIYCVSFCDIGAPYNHLFATVGGNRATVYECLPQGNIGVVQVYEDEDEEESFFACAWTIDALSRTPLLTVGGLRGIIKIIDCSSQSLVTTLLGHGNSINELVFHPVDRSLVLSASKDESLRLWNIMTGCCIAIFAGHQGHRDEVLSCDFHLLGKCIVSSGMDNTVKIWSLEDEKLQKAISLSYTDPTPENRPFETQFQQFPMFSTSKVHADYVDCVRWVGNLIMSKSTGDKLSLWKPNPTRAKDAVTLVREYHFASADIWFLKFALDANLENVAVGNKAGKVFVWSIDNNKNAENAKLSHPNCRAAIRQVAFHHDSRTIICSCDDATIWRWDAIAP